MKCRSDTEGHRGAPEMQKRHSEGVWDVSREICALLFVCCCKLWERLKWDFFFSPQHFFSFVTIILLVPCEKAGWTYFQGQQLPTIGVSGLCLVFLSNAKCCAPNLYPKRGSFKTMWQNLCHIMLNVRKISVEIVESVLINICGRCKRATPVTPVAVESACSPPCQMSTSSLTEANRRQRLLLKSLLPPLWLKVSNKRGRRWLPLPARGAAEYEG